MANEIVLYSCFKLLDFSSSRGYQMLLSALSSLSYRVTLTNNQNDLSICGYLGESLLDHSIIPVIYLDKLVELTALTNCLVELITVFKLNQLQISLDKTQLIKFHSHYKYLIMAYSQVGYRYLGRFVAKIQQLTPSLVLEYRQQLLSILAKGYTVSNQVNTLKHLQGYFRRCLSTIDKQQLTDLIEHYRIGKESLSSILQVFNDYLVCYPNNYLSQQYYLKDYLKLLLSVTANNSLCDIDNNEYSSGLV